MDTLYKAFIIKPSAIHNYWNNRNKIDRELNAARKKLMSKYLSGWNKF